MASLSVLGELLSIQGALHGLTHALEDTAAPLHVLRELLVLLFVPGASLVVSRALKDSLELLSAPR